jgi:hypothetical protein
MEDRGGSADLVLKAAIPAHAVSPKEAAGHGERAADREGLIAVAFEPLLVEVEAGPPVVFVRHSVY